MHLVLSILAAEAGDMGPNPIAPETKELVVGATSFLVFLAVMRLWLVPKVRAGMQMRADMVRSDVESAEATTAAARAEVARYEAALAEVRAEAAARLDKARAKADAERQAKMSVVNARIASRWRAAWPRSRRGWRSSPSARDRTTRRSAARSRP